MQSKPKSRRFIRHPSDIPLLVALDWVEDKAESAEHTDASLDNVSLGGLAFKSPSPILLGQAVKVSFPLLDREHSLNGQVVWNKKSGNGFEIGLQFSSQDELFHLRMIEQICHIEHYRNEVQQQEGRQLSSEEAATEWINLYAENFPPL